MNPAKRVILVFVNGLRFLVNEDEAVFLEVTKRFLGCGLVLRILVELDESQFLIHHMDNHLFVRLECVPPLVADLDKWIGFRDWSTRMHEEAIGIARRLTDKAQVRIAE